MGTEKKYEISDFAVIPVEKIPPKEEDEEKVNELFEKLAFLRDSLPEGLFEEDQDSSECDEFCGCDFFDPLPDRILKSGDRTICFWSDGTKTVVKRAADEPDNDYIAFTAALAKRAFGSNSAVKKAIAEKIEYQAPKKKKER